MDHRGSMGDEDYSTAKISVWWDIENCAVPASVNPHCIAQNVNSALRLANLNGPVTIDAFGDTKILKDVTQEALSSTGITLNHVPRGNKDAADKAILVGMLLWALDNPPPAYILLISGDGDFANALHRLRMKRYDVLLARPDARVKPALFQAAKCVWYWTSLARGQLSTSMNAENLEQPLSPKYAFSDGSTKEYKDSGNDSYGMSSSAILQRLNTQTFVSSSGSGNFASQDLPPSKYKESNAFSSSQWGDVLHVSNGSAVKAPGDSSSRSSTSSHFEKLHLQGDIKQTIYSEVNTGSKAGLGVSPSKTSKPQPYIAASNGERHHAGKKVFPHSTSNSALAKACLDFQEDARPSSPSEFISYTPGKITHNHGNDVGLGMLPHSDPLQSKYTEARLPNLIRGQTSQVETRPPSELEGGSLFFPRPYPTEKLGLLSHSAPLQSSYTEAMLPNLSRGQTSQVEIRPPPVVGGDSLLFPHPYSTENLGLHSLCAPLQSNYTEAKLQNLSRGQTSQVERKPSPVLEGGPLVFPHPYSTEKPRDPAQKLPDAHKVSLRKVLNAMEILKKDMLTPTEANLQDCIQYWERQLDNFNLKRTLEKAVDQHEVELMCVGAGGFRMFLPLNSQLWGCVDVGNMQSDYSNEVWMDFRRFLLNKHNCQLLANSQNRYAAAQILKKKDPGGFQSLVVGQVMNLLQQAVEQKKWLEVHVSGWLPLSINVQALLDFRVSQAVVSSLDSGQRQSGHVQPAKYPALQNNLRNDVIFELLRTWLVETLKDKGDYDISGVRKDFEKATGIRLDHKKLGFPKLQQLIEKFADIVHIEEGRKGLLLLRLVRQESLCEPWPSVKPRDSMELENQALWFDQSGEKDLVETANTITPKKVVVEKLKSWLTYVMADVQDGYESSEIQRDFLSASGINLDKYDLKLNKIQDILRSFSDIVHLEYSETGVCLVFPASKKPLDGDVPTVNKGGKIAAKQTGMHAEADRCVKLLNDCRVLLLDVLPKYKDGYPMARLKPNFQQQFGYELDFSIFGLTKLEALMGKFSDLVMVETAPQGHKLLHLKVSTS